ncbi:MAG: mechanosensitive ion channel family protein [Flavobacteriaceae bacterium]
MNWNEILLTFFHDLGVSPQWAKPLTLLVLFILTLLLALLLFLVFRKSITFIFHKIAKRSVSHFDDFLIQNKVPGRLSYLPPLFVLLAFLPPLITQPLWLRELVTHILEALFVVVILTIIRTFLLSIRDLLKTLSNFKDKPIDSYIQVFMILLWFVGIILILSLLTGKEIGTFLTGLGALSAVLLFVFKDTILGFVASVQITVNDTVRIGDWITMRNNDADGDVISISLSTVRVQNFDKTITSIPTYKLISDSFVNWRGMSESQGRRIKRALLIKVNSIRFLSSDEIAEIKRIERVNNFIEQREKEIKDYNAKNKADKQLLINGRNMTNLGLFRHYVETYLEKHEKINQEMTIMCRQLAPSPQGVPLEIYTFSKEKDWKRYEHIQADLFDHFLAATPYFHLECFEYSPIPPKV